MTDTAAKAPNRNPASQPNQAGQGGTATQAYRDGVGFSGGVVVAQVRSVAIDLLRATGTPAQDAQRLLQESIDRA